MIANNSNPEIPVEIQDACREVIEDWDIVTELEAMLKVIRSRLIPVGENSLALDFDALEVIALSNVLSYVVTLHDANSLPGEVNL